MFLRVSTRKKDGKEHRYFSIVENKRVSGGRVVQRHVLYLEEINSQELAWRKSIAVLEAGGGEKAHTISLFPEDRCEGMVSDESIVRLKLSQLRLERPRQWGGSWLALTLWRELKRDEFWAARLLPSRKGTRWDEVLAILTVYRLLSPGSEWWLHRQWYRGSALRSMPSNRQRRVSWARKRRTGLLADYGGTEVLFRSPMTATTVDERIGRCLGAQSSGSDWQ